MTNEPPFDDRLLSWSLAQLKVEETRNIYSSKKKARISTRIAEIENGLAEDPGKTEEADSITNNAKESGVNWTKWGTIILLVSVIVAAAGVYYSNS